MWTLELDFNLSDVKILDTKCTHNPLLGSNICLLISPGS